MRATTESGAGYTPPNALLSSSSPSGRLPLVAAASTDTVIAKATTTFRTGRPCP
ncbi:hypothetical protein [Streptomyces sp. NBC_00354]|uniref:hypothetical protein n=1 Tax=Streptomyces sp. NBC_00354 TaxID=2975723 RepID=UPI002E274AA1|nr:hypothetical protein OG296_33965 [Streptomyces sp. NBC_01001]